MKNIEIENLAINQVIVHSNLENVSYLYSYNRVVMAYNRNFRIMHVDRTYGFYSKTTSKYMTKFLESCGKYISLKDLRNRLNDLSDNEYIWKDLN